MIAEVIINSTVKSLNKTFDYEVPKNLKVEIGSRVFIPFGKSKNPEEGIVVGLKEKSEFKVKEILKLQAEKIEKEKINLAKYMSDRYFCNISDCLKLMLPPGTKTKNTKDRVKEKTINLINIAKEKEEIEKAIEEKKIKSDRQIAILEFVINNGVSSIEDIELFTDGTKAIVSTLIKNGYLEYEETKVERNPFLHKILKKEKEFNLTEEQRYAVENIKEEGEYLLFGVTGSGKTEVYLRLIERELNKNKSSIMLVPEISLTPQTVDRFISRFGEDKIAVLHSKLSVGERFDQWNKIKEGRAKIVIGARSAIFAPVKDLGIVIIDEEHDESYISEMTPRYNAKEVARFITKTKHIPLVLGSATPDISTYYNAKEGNIRLLELTKRANQGAMPVSKIIDLREELANGNKTMISRELEEEIKNNLECKKQTILFLNRRGFSTFIMCRDCGYTVKCKRCNITMTYHKRENKLKCHYCGYEENAVKVCPMCHSENIRYFGAGTQKLEEEIKEKFPEATTIRMDVDTVSKKNSHEEILTKFREEKIDILIGTQMVVKGHDFPDVTLVGVISADSSLNFGDFKATERTFQTLTQVIGRAGRGEAEGRALIQTYNPDNYAIEYAKIQDYNLFYNTEIMLRKQLKYPPFCDIILIDVSSTKFNELEDTEKRMHKYLKERVINEKFGLLLYSPVPAPIDKIKDRYRGRILIKCKYDSRIKELLLDSLKEFYKMKKKDVRVNIELNPNNML